MQIQLQDMQNGRRVTFQGPNALIQNILILRKENKYQKILQLAQELPNNVQTYMLKANSLLRLKQWNRLIQCCEAGIDLDENQSQFYNLKGKALGKLGNMQEKIDLVTKAIKINDLIPAYHRNLGAAFYSLNKYPHAVVSHTKAIQLEPNNAINYHNKGASLFRNQQIEQAYKFFKKATQINDQLSASYAWVGDCSDKLGNKIEAFQNYSKAYELSNNALYYQQKLRLEKQIKSAHKMQMSKEQPKKKKKFLGIF